MTDLKTVFNKNYCGTPYRIVEKNNGDLAVQCCVVGQGEWLTINGDGPSVIKNENYMRIICEALLENKIKMFKFV